MLEKEGCVSAHGDLCGIVLVVTGSFTVLFQGWGLHAFSRLGSQRYFGLHFTSCFFFHTVCAEKVQAGFKLGLLFSPGDW